MNCLKQNKIVNDTIHNHYFVYVLQKGLCFTTKLHDISYIFIYWYLIKMAYKI